VDALGVDLLHVDTVDLVWQQPDQPAGPQPAAVDLEELGVFLLVIHRQAVRRAGNARGAADGAAGILVFCEISVDFSGVAAGRDFRPRRARRACRDQPGDENDQTAHGSFH
jgi:hypothetical protein